jgi:hypothetical protein
MGSKSNTGLTAMRLSFPHWTLTLTGWGWTALIAAVILVDWGCYHFGYVNGYADALAWAKGVRWDQ